MAKGSQNAAAGTITQAQNNSDALTSNANGIYSSLAPALMTEAANPQGFAPADLANMNTRAQETAGGATSGAIGRGALLAGRTHNAGTASKAISDAARTGGEQLATTEQGIQAENAGLKAKEHAAGLQGLEGVYGTDISGANTALGEVAPLANAETQSEAANNPFTTIINPLTEAVLGNASSLKGAFGCWIAEAIYGTDDWRTHTVRAWLNGPFRETVIGSAIMSLYLSIGRQVAWVARRSSLLRATLKPLFDAALRRAVRDANS